MKGEGVLHKLFAYILGPKDDKNIVHLPLERGNGFVHKGNEFIHHTELHHFETAFFNLVRHQKIVLGVIAALLALSLVLNWHLTLVVFFSVSTIIYFFGFVFDAFLVFRTFKHRPEINITKEDIAKADTVMDWPRYTIFCPLYKEWQVVPQFVDAMKKLDYPKEKLQIMFLLEENDPETIEKVREAGLPSYFEVVVVPHSKPKTKPKAMNYGLKHATGDFLVIYDAEDVPDTDQLKKAVLAFTKVGEENVCIQAKLNFYNPKQNILTRIFTAEYSLWFDLVLPGLQSISAPIPLGGTSNHFKVPVLRELAGWDAFNVTEDCDLGMRLAKRGYRTSIVDSTTHEEANSDLRNWYNQRSRWIKGYIQTYFVHMRNPFASYKGKRGIRNLILFQFIVGSKTLGLFINPIMWTATIMYFAFRAQIGPFIESLFPGPILYIGVFSLLFGNFFYLYYYMVGCAKRGYDDIIKYVFLVPFYWLSMSAAAWQALYEIFVKPHYWAKTVHGLHLAGGKTKIDWAKHKDAAEDKPVAIQEEKKEFPVAFAPVVQPVVASAIIEPIIERVVEPVAEPVIDPVVKKPVIREQYPALAFLFSGAGLLILSSIVANVINFGFSAYLGRALTLDDFGTVIMVNTFAYVLALFVGALSTTATHIVSYLEGQSKGRGSNFFATYLPKLLIPGVTATLIWVAAAPFLADFLNVSNTLIILTFAPAIMFGVLGSFNAGYLKGVWSFGSLAGIQILEPIVKLLAAFGIVMLGLHAYAAVSIPISIVAAWVATTIAVLIVHRKTSHTDAPVSQKSAFPMMFYAAAFLNGLSVTMFLSIDVILAKHYLSAADAGVYSMLSVIGKMIFFFGSLFNTFIVTVVSRAEGERRSSHKEFSRIFLVTSFLTVSAGIGLVVLGPWLVPFLLGENARAIVPYLSQYSLAMVLFTISMTIVLYRLSRKEYLFSGLSLFMSLELLYGLYVSHGSVADFVQIMLNVNIEFFVLFVIAHYLYPYIVYSYRNLRDIIYVFRLIPKAAKPQPGKMRILVFNWRDTKSVFAGGAETYVQSLASRWVKDGHAVTLFTSNDGHLPRDGETDGVRIIRRGGFYTTYVIAFFYYMIHFRGRFDVIIDSENGIPFFTPFYAKEPVYLLLHHVHQEVFRKALPWPLAQFACFLEKTVMPYAYRNSDYITVSDSSKREMRELGIAQKDIQIVYPGIDTDFLKPGKKAAYPLVSYVGRLQEHKSVHVLVKAFPAILEAVPNAKLAIAGDGTEMDSLISLAKKLGIADNVTFHGKVSEEKKREIMQSSWVCVNPSMMEGWGITSIEANACGTPVVASDVPGLQDSVKDGMTGVLVPYGDVDLFAKEIITLIKDETLRGELSANAVAWGTYFAWEKSSDRFIEIVSQGITTLQKKKTQIKVERVTQAIKAY